MKKLKKLMSLVITLSVSLSMFGCGQKASSTNSSNSKQTQSLSSGKLDSIKKSGKLVLGTSAGYPPYEFHLVKDGKDEITGFDITIAKELAIELGVELQIKDMSFEGLLPALNAGTIDLIIAGMTPTEERKKSVDFSKIYYTAQQAVLIRAENNDKIKDLSNLNGKKVGAQKSSVQESMALNQLKESQCVSLAKVPDLILSLKNKNVDALVMEYPVAKQYAKANKDLLVSDVKLQTTDEGSAIAVKKGNEDFLNSINTVLDKLMKEDKINKFVDEATALADEK